jgi:biopolymer transport protein ExbB/TolQ
LTFRILLPQVLVTQLVTITILTIVLFTFHLIEWTLQNEQLDEIKQLTSNTQTTLEKQRQLITDVKELKEGQQKIMEQLGKIDFQLAKNLSVKY